MTPHPEPREEPVRLSAPVGLPFPVAWLLVLLMALTASFWVSSQAVPPFLDDPDLNFGLMKAGHFTGYALIGGLLVTTIVAWMPRLRVLASAARGLGSPARLALLLAILWAASDEYHQSLTPHGTPAVTDVLIDSCGALVGIWIAGRLRARVGRAA